MHIESLVRLIQAFTPSQLQDAAVHYLKMRGYSSPELSDGWSDGGADVRLVRIGGTASRMAIQLSVERNWQAKIAEDLKKAIKNYQVESFLFISNRRLPELPFQRLRDRLKRETGITIERVDSQSLASAFFEEGKTEDLLHIAGVIAKDASENLGNEESFVSQATYSYLFLSDDVRSLRDGVVESIILSFVYDSKSATDLESVTSLGSALARETAAPARQVRALESAIDRMLQRGSLILDANRVEVSPRERDLLTSSRALRAQDWALLRSQVEQLLQGAISNATSDNTDRVMQHLGATATDLGIVVRGAFSRKDPNVLRAHMQKRVRSLDATLHELGLSDSADRHAVVQKLVEVSSDSPTGKALAATEIFAFLGGLAVSDLSVALGGRSTRPVLVIDSNVAMPMLLNLFYGSADTRFFLVARRVYEEAKSLDLELKLPRDYLEEAAAHLIKAAQKYGPVVDSDPDLAFSTNAFVAHYATLKKARKMKERSFVSYLSDLGATPATLARPFMACRNALMIKLGDLIRRYNVTSCFAGDPDQVMMAAAETEFAFTSRNLGRPRSGITARHDARTLAHLREESHASADLHVLVTWDRTLLGMDQSDASWAILDPAATVDLLSMTSDLAGGLSMLSSVSTAMALSEQDSERGAQIIDWFVESNVADLSDADQRAKAMQFKAQYLRSASETRDEILRDAWNSWNAGQSTRLPHTPA